MKAFVLDRDGCGLRDVPEPTSTPGRVVVRTTAAGLCHSDLTLASRAPEEHPFALPLVLGHELAGTVVETGPGVDHLRVGDEVVGYGPRGCGRCDRCSSGAENYCQESPSEFSPGLGSDGALAEFISVDAGHLLASDGLAPAQAAALSDAGLTAYHALERAFTLSDRPREGLRVAVLGVGGLGHFALQLAKLAGSQVVAVDRSEVKRELARELSADHVFDGGSDTAAAVADLTAGRGCDVVLDLVSAHATLDLAKSIVAKNGVVSVVGVGSARLPVGIHALPLGTRTDLPFWGTRTELLRLLELARTGRVRAVVEHHSLDDVHNAYARLERGEVNGRAVVSFRTP